jgi:hypothetical protein
VNEMELYGSGGGRQLSRRAGRALSSIQGGAAISIARIEARADIQAAQVDAMSAVTQRALQGAAFLTQIEAQLGQAVPMAVCRLQAVSDIGTLGLSQIVMDTATNLRRI